MQELQQSLSKMTESAAKFETTEDTSAVIFLIVNVQILINAMAL